MAMFDFTVDDNFKNYKAGDTFTLITNREEKRKIICTCIRVKVVEGVSPNLCDKCLFQKYKICHKIACYDNVFIETDRLVKSYKIP